MPLDVLLLLANFCFVSSITPGPNNLMLLASGVNFGFRQTLPHMLGVGFGFMFMLICVGLGLGQLIKLFPVLETVMKVLGSAYMLYLAWRIANSGPVKSVEIDAKPMTFLQACAFQWVNPKAWGMATIAMSAYTSIGDFYVNVAIVVLVFGLINIPCVAAWTGMGTQLRGFLSDPRKLQIFNITMALLLVVSIYPMVR